MSEQPPAAWRPAPAAGPTRTSASAPVAATSRPASPVQWPEPLTVDEARVVLDRWAHATRRADGRVLDAELSTRDQSVAVLTVEALVEERSATTVRLDAVAFDHPTIPRTTVAEVPVRRPADLRAGQQSFVYHDSIRTSRDGVCHGRGEVDCSACGGTGDVPCDRFEPCPACSIDQGRGGSRGPDRSFACRVCLGNERRPCSTCGGIGRRTCPVCAGRRRFSCTHCSGRGELLVGEVVTVTWTVRSTTVEVGRRPTSRRRHTVAGRGWTVDGNTVPSGLPPRVADAASSLLASRPGDVAHRLRVEVLPVTVVTMTMGSWATEAAVVGDDHVVVADEATRAGDRRLAVVLVAAAAVAAAVAVLLQLG